ncbi:hypothetical protein M426DRAFT_326169 [Hypoxylon sp. CI-4A]|nr:hypothetical protein M426DRAFT_326169 [Hypoxylon sp. CI-4A]
MPRSIDDPILRQPRDDALYHMSLVLLAIVLVNQRVGRCSSYSCRSNFRSPVMVPSRPPCFHYTGRHRCLCGLLEIWPGAGRSS